MSGFRVATPSSRPDPFKRVKYSLGLVLGVDEFEQEQAYFLEADRRHARSLHGYGVVCGLEVTNDGLEVRVSPGLAISPKGREIRLPEAHCGRIDEWLAVPQNRERLEEAPRPPSLDPGMRSLYVVLCYLECETDEVPIPGAPCQSEEESMAPSRIAESFDLKFSPTPPDQTEDEAIKAFGRLLERLEISSDPDDEAIDPDRMAEEVRSLLDLFPNDGSEPAEPDETPLFVRPGDLAAVLDAALTTWVTQVRPALLPGDKACACGPPDEDCVLLARVDFAVDDAGQVDPESARVVMDRRPHLVQTRLLSELLRHTSEGVTVHGRLGGLDQDDHPQYLLVDPATRALVSDLDAGGNLIKNLKPGTQPGEAVTAEVAVKVGDPAGGDLAGAYPNPEVAALKGAPVVDNPAKQSGWVLTWTGSEWTPRPAAGGGGDLKEIVAELPVIPFVTVTRVPRLALENDPDRFLPSFELWFHIDAGDAGRANLPALVEKFPFEVYGESAGSPPFLQPVKVAGLLPKPGARNVFLALVEEEVDDFQELRFIFPLSEMEVRDPDGGIIPLLDWMLERPLKWVGHDGRETVTAFYKNDVRQRVIASGTYDLEGRVLVAHNLTVSRSFIGGQLPAELLTWGGYEVAKRHRYVVKGAALWVDGRLGIESPPLDFHVVAWDREGVLVFSRQENGEPPRAAAETSVEISEIL